MSNHWFDVDKHGLAKLIEQHGHGRLVAELIQNALDEKVSQVLVTLQRTGRTLYHLMVQDNSPEGFKRLDHAWTLFAESYKKGLPDKRGRFNLGEKLVLAMCRTAEISSTTGTVYFQENGKREVNYRRKRDEGTVFSAQINMTMEQFNEACSYVKTVLVPPGVQVCFNGEYIQSRVPVKVFRAELDTEICNDEGVPSKSRRQADVELYEVQDVELPHIYEMGIPVVDVEEVGLRWHINVKQKIPLNFNRDNVTPAYLRRLLTLTMNSVHQELSEQDAGQPWVTQATSDPNISPEAMKKFLDLHVGEKRASYDPTDPEANQKWQSQGGVVLYGRQLNAEQWDNARKNDLIVSAGRLCPTPKPYSDDPNAPPVTVIPESEYSEGMKNIVAFSKYLATELMGIKITVRLVDTTNNFSACYGNSCLDFNVKALGKQWFDQGVCESVLGPIIHEFGHEYEGNHLSENYHKALTKLGAKLAMAALNKPKEFQDFMI